MKNVKTLYWIPLCLVIVACGNPETTKLPDVHLGDGRQYESFNHQISGPALDGTWMSTCVNSFSTSKIITMRITGQTILRQTQYYKELNCHYRDDDFTSEGKFRYMSQKNSIYEVDYRYDMNGGYQYLSENIRLDSFGLWVSDYSIGDVDPRILMRRIDSLNF